MISDVGLGNETCIECDSQNRGRGTGSYQMIFVVGLGNQACVERYR